MPTYDYECPKGHSFEAFQKMTARPFATCPKCGAKARRKISGGAGLLFKGEGFYITDYRSEEYKKKATVETDGTSSKEKAKTDDKEVAASAPRAKAGAKRSNKSSDD
jgi:putative FmdB family regulatory protein